MQNEPTTYFGPSAVYDKKILGTEITVTLKREDSEDKYELSMPLSVFENVKTEEPQDWNYVQKRKLESTVGLVMTVLAEGGITGAEFKAFLQTLSLSFYGTIDRAINLNFMGNDASYVPGGDLYFDFSLNRSNEILKDVNETKSDTTA